MPERSKTQFVTNGSLVNLIVAGVLSLGAPAFAQDKEAESRPVRERIAPSATHHGVTIGGKRIRYTATAGTITLAEEDWHRKGGSLFHSLRQGGHHGLRPPTPLHGFKPDVAGEQESYWSH